MEPMSVIDHVTGKFQTDKSPMNIGGLLLFEVPTAEKAAFAARVREHLSTRLPASPLGRRLIASPDCYDSNTWFRLSGATTLARVSTPKFSGEMSYGELLAYVARRSMSKLDLSSSPYELEIIDAVQGPVCALYLKVHHTCMDGVAFQMLVELLSDQGGPLPDVDTSKDEAIPSDDAWMEMARQRFEREAPAREETARAHANAGAKLAEFLSAPEHARSEAATMAFGSEITTERTYRTISFPVEGIRRIGKAYGATINDIYLTLAAGALRAYLLAQNEMPDTTLVAHCVRSSRRPQDGMVGNRVVSIYPVLATDEPDRAARLARIRASMNIEKQRSMIEEILADMPETPYGCRDRNAAFADPAVLNAALGSANVVLSNVPGPPHALTYAGFKMTGNYPVPIVGPDRFLNITSRRNGDNLDMGVMVDAAKVTKIDDFIAQLQAEFNALRTLSDR